jgi:hypothetical protein
MLHLDPEVRRRVDKAVRRGERARSRAEARLVVSQARANLRTLPLLIGAALMLGILRLVWIIRRGPEVWDLLVLGVVAVLLAKVVLWDRPRLRRAERLNRPLLQHPEDQGN